MSKKKQHKQKVGPSPTPPNIVKRDDKGHMLPGQRLNPGGRPPGSNFLQEFIDAKNCVEKEKKQSLLKHFLRRAWESDKVLIACVEKILPSLRAIELTTSPSEWMSDEIASSIRDKLKERYDARKTQVNAGDAR